MIAVWQEAGLPIKIAGRDSREAIARQIADYPDFFIGAYDGQRLIGLVVASSDGRKGWINRLAVLPAYRRKKIARKLIARAEQVLFAAGIRVVACLIHNDNLPSLRLFTSQGYDSSLPVIYLRKALSETD